MSEGELREMGMSGVAYIDHTFFVLRVPDGWIYYRYKSSEGVGDCGTFVPERR